MRGKSICVEDADVLSSQFHPFGFFNFSIKIFASLVRRSIGLSPNALSDVNDAVDDVIALLWLLWVRSESISVLFDVFFSSEVLRLCVCD